MTVGNRTGLYSDAAGENDKRQRQQELKEATQPKEPEFATEFESRLYYAERGDFTAQNSVEKHINQHVEILRKSSWQPKESNEIVM